MYVETKKRSILRVVLVSVACFSLGCLFKADASWVKRCIAESLTLYLSFSRFWRACKPVAASSPNPFFEAPSGIAELTEMVGAWKRETLPVAHYLTFHTEFPSLVFFCRACTGMPVNRTEGGWGRWGRGVVWGEQRSSVTAFQGFWAVQGERRAGWGVARMAIKYGRASIETEHRGGQALSVHTYSRARNGDCGSSMFVVHCAIFAQPFICAAVA